jgi:hypothetical protein
MSTIDATSWAGATGCLKLLDPSCDLRAEPELDAAFTKVDDRLGHVVVGSLILADGVAVRQAENVGDALSVDQVIDGDLFRHDG